MKKIIVLGGGTAGWLTALLVREFYPDFDITLVESDAIGILGAGEGTVPHIVSVLDLLKIPVSALFKYCSATLKTGIKFTNWHGDGTSYFHNFSANDELEMWSLDRMFRFNVLPTMLVGQNINLDEASFVAKIAAQGKVPFVWPTAESIAMKYGRIWKIPVQDRYGCGYVFDSSFIDNNEARLEAQEYFGCEINTPGTFKFEAGSFRKSLVKNCFAVGL